MLAKAAKIIAKFTSRWHFMSSYHISGQSHEKRALNSQTKSHDKSMTHTLQTFDNNHSLQYSSLAEDVDFRIQLGKQTSQHLTFGFSSS